MLRLMRILAAAAVLLPLTATAGTTVPKLVAENPGKKIAVVSISANNFNNSLQGWNTALTSDLMQSRTGKMLEIAERLFADKWTVVAASSFVANPAFQTQAGTQMEVGIPIIGGNPLPVMAENRKELIKANMSEDKAKALAAVTGADFLVVIYSEWAVQTGKFVPTTKALAKNVMGIFNAQGKQVYQGRSDRMGKKTLGMMGQVAVDENTIDEWVDAYRDGITALNSGTK
jgi:hypothetical protein